MSGGGGGGGVVILRGIGGDADEHRIGFGYRSQTWIVEHDEEEEEEGKYICTFVLWCTASGGDNFAMKTILAYGPMRKLEWTGAIYLETALVSPVSRIAL